MFTPNANLSNIVFGGIQNPQVNSVIHKTHIEVSEKGAVAAAVTGAVVIPLMGTTLEVMNINHPFLFFIRDKTTGAILFGGRVNEPTLYRDNQRAQGQSSAQRRPAAQQQSGRPNNGNAQNPSPQNVQQNRPISPVNKSPVMNRQDSSNNFNSQNEQQPGGKDQQTSTYSRGAENNIGKPDLGHANINPLSSQSSALNNNHALPTPTRRPDLVAQFVSDSGTPLAQSSNQRIMKNPSDDSIITFHDRPQTYSS